MSAHKLLSKACKCEQHGRFFQALHCFHEGLNILTKIIASENDMEKKLILIADLKDWRKQGKRVKALVRNLTTCRKFVEAVSFPDNSEGHDYENVFGKYLDKKLIEILLQEPCIATPQEFENLTAFMEIVVKHCTNLKFMRVVTNEVVAEEKQIERMTKIKSDVARYGIAMSFVLTDRIQKFKMALNNGIIIKVDSGLHYFKDLASQCCLGVVDYDFRTCKKTTIGVYSNKSN